MEVREIGGARRPALEWFHAVFGAVCLCGLAVLVLRSPAKLIWDEPQHLSQVGTVRGLGLTREMLLHFKTPTGPAFAVLHAWLGIESPLAARFFSLASLVVVLASLAVIGGKLSGRIGALSAVSLLGMPLVWPPSVLALTEMPALAFLTSSLALLLCVRRRDDAGPLLGMAGAATAGLLMSVAILIRQPLLLVHLATILFVLDASTHRARLALFFVLGIAAPAVVFSVWGGLVAPHANLATRYAVRWESGPLAAGYAALLVFLVAPEWLWRDRWLAALGVLAGAAGNLLVFHVQWAVAAARGPDYANPGTMQFVVAGALMGLGIAFGVSVVRLAVAARRDAVTLFCAVSCLALLAAPIMITHQFSSRYCVPALAFGWMLALRHAPGRPAWRAAGMILGAAAGAWTVLRYFAHYA